MRDNGSYNYSIAVLATTNLSTRWLYLSASDGADYKYTPPSSSYVFRIGMAYRAAHWQYLEIDLQEWITDMEPGETLLHVDAIVPMVYDLKIDDIKLSEGRLNRSWAQVPGVALEGYLGAQTGSEGANGVDAWDKYYYHFSDLGTVMATTDDAGAMLGVYQPDFWGNYRETSGTRPDTMGLTGKFFDTDVQAYDFGARWYDSERGRWLSEEPFAFDGPNLYHFVFNDPVNYYDHEGYFAVCAGVAGVYLGIQGAVLIKGAILASAAVAGTAAGYVLTRGASRDEAKCEEQEAIEKNHPDCKFDPPGGTKSFSEYKKHIRDLNAARQSIAKLQRALQAAKRHAIMKALQEELHDELLRHQRHIRAPLKIRPDFVG